MENIKLVKLTKLPLPAMYFTHLRTPHRSRGQLGETSHWVFRLNRREQHRRKYAHLAKTAYGKKLRAGRLPTTTSPRQSLVVS